MSEIVTVEGVTQKGKNRVREHGSIWTVERRLLDNVLLKAGDGYLKWMMPDLSISEKSTASITDRKE